MDADVIRTEGLTKHFGDVRAVEDLDLVVEQGEAFGCSARTGRGRPRRSGCCRTSCARAGDGPSSWAAPAPTPRSGAVSATCRAIPDRPSYRAADVIEFFGALRGNVDRAWVDALLPRFDLDPTRPVGELSTGNRRKVGLVQAFMSRPELLLLDEPTSGLDPLLRHEFNALVREVAADGATVLLSSHVLPEVEALAGRVGIVRRGRLVAVAGVEELRRGARQRLQLHLAGPPGQQEDLARFRAVPEVVEVSARGPVVDLVVEGVVGGVVQVAAGMDVQRIVSHEANLEDVFLPFYAPDGGSPCGREEAR